MPTLKAVSEQHGQDVEELSEILCLCVSEPKDCAKCAFARPTPAESETGDEELATVDRLKREAEMIAREAGFSPDLSGSVEGRASCPDQHARH